MPSKKIDMSFPLVVVKMKTADEMRLMFSERHQLFFRSYRMLSENYCTSYSTCLKEIEKINATAPQPQRNVLKYFAIYKNVAQSLESGETPSYSASHQAPKLCTTFLNLAKHDEITSKINLQEPQHNRNRTANYFNLIKISTVRHIIHKLAYQPEEHYAFFFIIFAKSMNREQVQQ